MCACSMDMVAPPHHLHAALEKVGKSHPHTCAHLFVHVSDLWSPPLPSGLSHIYSVIVLNTEQALKQFTTSGPKFKFGAGLEVGHVQG